MSTRIWKKIPEAENQSRVGLGGSVSFAILFCFASDEAFRSIRRSLTISTSTIALAKSAKIVMTTAIQKAADFSGMIQEARFQASAFE